MNKKICMAIGILLIGLIATVALSAQGGPDPTCTTDNGSIGITNPAAIYCEELGYEYMIISGADGQQGVCVLPDKKQCDEWAFLNGGCGQEYSYCAQQGHQLTTVSDGKNPFSIEYAVCLSKEGDSIGSVADLMNLSEKATRGSVQLSNPVTTFDMDKSSTSSFDWRYHNGSDWMTSVKNQGLCGSCWAFSSIGAVEAVNNIRAGSPDLGLDLSEQYLASDCAVAPGSCCGGWHDDALDYIRDHGVSNESCFPYDDTGCVCNSNVCQCSYNGLGVCSDETCSNRCSNWRDSLTMITGKGAVSPSDIKSRVVDKGPLVVDMGFGDYAGAYWDNDVYRCSNDLFINHSVVIVGYDDGGDYWIAKNSWGSTWHNNNGYFKVGYGECGIEGNVHYVDRVALPSTVTPPPSTDCQRVTGSNGDYWYECDGVKVTQTARQFWSDGIYDFQIVGDRVVWRYRDGQLEDYAYHSNRLAGGSITQITQTVDEFWNDRIDNVQIDGDRVFWRYRDGQLEDYAYHYRCLFSGSIVQITQTADEFWGDRISNFTVSGNTVSWYYYDGQHQQGSTHSDTLSSCVPPTPPPPTDTPTPTNTPEPTNDAEFVAQSVPTTMVAGTKYWVWIEMKNTGETTWTRDDRHKLGSQNPQGNQTWGKSRVRLPEGVSVEPTHTYRFNFHVTAPTDPDTYDFQWRMLQELAAGWFGEYTENVSITVRAPINDAQFVAQSVPSTMVAGETYPVWVEMENTGETTWTRDDRYRLGSQNPRDNQNWGRIRISLPVGVSVEPGQTYSFTFNATAPTDPDNYNFQWRMVQEQAAGWFGDYTNNVSVQVVPDCSGTDHKWQSDYYGQVPHESLDQPDPPVCLNNDLCLHSNGSSVSHGTLSGDAWICSWDNIDGRQQGAWYSCESTRAGANKVIEDHECQQVGSGYAWLIPTATPTLSPTPTNTPTPTPPATPTPIPCPGTDLKWQSDYYGQVPHESPDQPDPPVCLNNDLCLHSNGSSVYRGTISGDWICSRDNIAGRSQGAWYLCESTRAGAHKVIEGYVCTQAGSGYAWLIPTITPTPTPSPTSTPTPTPTPTPCPGTEHKWQSDYYGQPPYESPGQPNPPVCRSDDRCLHSNGSAVTHATLSGTSWICSWDNLDGRTQGVWYQCDVTRSNADKVIEGYECQPVSGGYEWLPLGP